MRGRLILLMLASGFFGMQAEVNSNAAMRVESKTNNLRKDAEKKMDQLKSLIKKAEKKNIQTLKERTSLRSAEIFMKYADWDEANVEKNTVHFSLVTRYNKEPEKWAEMLPSFEREEIIKMMDSSIAELKAVMDGKIKRLPSPEVDWRRTKVQGDAIMFEGQPVFLNDWTWKPSIDEYNEYHGNQDGFFLTPSYVINEKGDVKEDVMEQLKSKDDGSMGFVFFNHTSMPSWAKEKDPTITDGAGIKYTMYDINNPLSRKIQSDLISKVVPHMAGKQYVELGYMLCNEPHWNTIEKEWAAAPISDLAYQDFKKWLISKHKNISTLNAVWGKNYSSFDAIDCPKIMKKEMQGTPMYFDFMAFNMDRVTDWFKFLQTEIKKHDPAAKTHIKIMPNLWSDNKRDSGIDMEALTYDSDIIGNDAGSCGKWMWGAPHHWEEHYSFDWLELCMSYDFYKSVSPEKVMYNTEGHFLSTGKTRDLYMPTDYVRLNYWMAYVNGLTAQQTWYWCRREDGDSRSNEDSNGYAGSNNHQPRVVNEVHTTLIDLNSVSDYIMDMQRQKKPIRIFYTKASSINKPKHMDDVFAAYESMYFDGIPVGFATEGIIEKQDNKLWDVIVVAKTPYAFESDIEALQSYINQGGTVVVDSESLKTNEYGQALKTKLKSSKGQLVVLPTMKEVTNKAVSVVMQSEDAPSILLKETNGMDQSTTAWKVVKSNNGGDIVNVANLGKNQSKISLSRKDGKPIKSVTNVLTGEKLPTTLDLPIYGLLLLEIN